MFLERRVTCVKCSVIKYLKTLLHQKQLFPSSLYFKEQINLKEWRNTNWNTWMRECWILYTDFSMLNTDQALKKNYESLDIWRLFYSSLLSSREVPGRQILCSRDVPAGQQLSSRDVPGRQILCCRDVPARQQLCGRDVPAKRFLFSRDDNCCLCLLPCSSRHCHRRSLLFQFIQWLAFQVKNFNAVWIIDLFSSDSKDVILTFILFQ